MKWRSGLLSCGAALLLLLGACANNRPSVVPMRAIPEPSPCGPADTLLVMLPGSYSRPEDFIREGFVQTLRDRRVAADVLLVDAHVGYYEDRSIVDRLHADVVKPARARGYRQVWIAGISIGAVGAMLYADEHPREIDGVVLLAPFLGSRLSVLDIENAGGLDRWQPPAPAAGEGVELRLWRWLKRETSAADHAVPHRTAIYQGYGVDDRFAHNNALLSRALPPRRVFTADGGHDWPAWNALWARMVPALPLPSRDTACPAATK